MQEGIRDTSGQDVMLEKANHKHWLKWAIPLVVLGILGMVLVPVLSTWLSAEATVSADRVRTAVVDRGDLVRDLNVQGRVVAAVSPTTARHAPNTSAARGSDTAATASKTTATWMSRRPLRKGRIMSAAPLEACFAPPSVPPCPRDHEPAYGRPCAAWSFNWSTVLGKTGTRCTLGKRISWPRSPISPARWRAIEPFRLPVASPASSLIAASPRFPAMLSE